MTKVSVIFLDRDGVINEQAPPHQYITRWKDFRVLPGVYEAIQVFNVAGFKIFIVSNQRCIARGMATAEVVEKLHEQLKADMENHDCYIDDIYFCPHDEADNCDCRKPKTGMLERAKLYLEAKGLAVDKNHSWMIGDFTSDIQTGINFGINTAQVLSGGTDTSREKLIITDNLQHIIVSNLLCAAKKICVIKN